MPMAMAKKKTSAGKSNNLGVPTARGCLSCNRWDAFMKRVWEEEREICPPDGCIKLLNVNVKKPDSTGE
ncbi:MAG: hypothetical protein BWY14_01298 [Parcubacteria group bacterium ADurb.Bin192]|nr:MAG: hypothetical protein BWY14_01298 [Parcubacteria group bacterium ADurb.Bin192]